MLEFANQSFNNFQTKALRNRCSWRWDLGSENRKKEIKTLEDMLARERGLNLDGPTAIENDVALSVIQSVRHYNLENEPSSAAAVGRRCWDVNRVSAASCILQTLFSYNGTRPWSKPGFNFRDAARVRELEAVTLSLISASCSVATKPAVHNTQSILSRFFVKCSVDCEKFVEKNQPAHPGKHVCPLYTTGSTSRFGLDGLLLAPCAMEYADRDGVLAHCAKTAIHVDNGASLARDTLRQYLLAQQRAAYRCLLCNGLFLFLWHFIEHLLCHHHGKLDSTTSAGYWCCDVCGQSLPSERNLVGHYFLVHLMALA